MVYLCLLPMANQGAYVIKKSTPFEVIPVPSGIFMSTNDASWLRARCLNSVQKQAARVKMAN
jgi:hypothetical protein